MPALRLGSPVFVPQRLPSCSVCRNQICRQIRQRQTTGTFHAHIICHHKEKRLSCRRIGLTASPFCRLFFVVQSFGMGIQRIAMWRACAESGSVSKGEILECRANFSSYWVEMTQQRYVKALERRDDEEGAESAFEEFETDLSPYRMHRSSSCHTFDLRGALWCR